MPSNPIHLISIVGLCAAAGLSGCASDELAGARYEDAADNYYCDDYNCSEGWHCEFDQCVPDGNDSQLPPALPSSSAETRSPLASLRYVFTLSSGAKKLVRIDSQSLEVASFAVGLSPMDMAVVGSREISVVIDEYDSVEMMDHTVNPPLAAAWTTARSLSRVVLSPTGDHALLFYDWDDSRSPTRQSEPGNINQLSVLDLKADADGFADDDDRLVDVSVGFLPRDIRFAVDGSRAVVISETSITLIELSARSSGTIAAPAAPMPFNASAPKVVLNSSANLAVLRYADSPRIDVLDLDTAASTCFVASGSITDIVLTKDDELLVMNQGVDPDDEQRYLSLTTLGAAVVAIDDVDCTVLAESGSVGTARLLAMGNNDEGAMAYLPSLSSEEIFAIDLSDLTSFRIALEKSVAGIAFVGDGRHLLVSHLKAPGTPQWDISIEHPEESVDKSYGVTWIDLDTKTHRLAISDEPFGSFTFVDEGDGNTATYQALRDPLRPQLLRVSHTPGFDDVWFDLAGLPVDLGYLADTGRAYITQEHPYGRVTFIDGAGNEMRHVTGFNISSDLGGAP